MIETTLNGKTKDIVQDNIEQLKQLFPEIIIEDKIDFDKLREILGEEIDDTNERYDFTWKGKHEATKIALTSSEGTLRPDKESSKNWETTENLYIEGDNLEVLKLLQKSYYGKIKCIYIDPPYNTGKDFVYQDNFKENLKNYIIQDEEGFNVSSNPETSGRYHTNWLNMIYPRLKLARNLLKEEGAIFISIDDNENYNLRQICNSIFGENNFISEFIWQKTYAPKNNNKYVSTDHETILCYVKNINKIQRFNRLERDEKTNSMYKYDDNDGRGKYRFDNLTVSKQKGYDIKWNGKVYPEPENCGWRFPEKKMYELIKENRVYLPEDTSKRPAFKRYLKDVEGIISKTILPHEEVGHTDSSKRHLMKLLDGNIFDYPKPVDLIKRFLILTTNEDDIILDFFAGSSTTAQAIFELNNKENTSRKFILVQLPELTEKKSVAYQKGYNNICEIGKERIRRAGDILSQDNSELNIDIGFKVFKLDYSNLTKWNPDIDNLEDSLINVRDNIVEGRTELDLVYEIMLKYGLELTLPVEEIESDGYTFYSVGMGSLVVCLNNHIQRDITESVLKIKEQLSPNIMRVVFKDNGFESDSDKTNVKEILRNNEVDEFITI